MLQKRLSKICTLCSRDLPFSAFHKHATAKFGLRPHCKDCIHKSRTEYYKRTQERSQEYSRDYYQKNADSVKRYQKKYAKQNRTRIRNRHAAWRSKHRPRLLHSKRQDYVANKEHYAAINRLYQQQHPEYGRVGHHRRRALKAGASGDFTAKQLLEKFAFHGWRCYLCHEHLTIKELEIDHRIPLSQGGSNWISNIAPACHKCNQAKGNQPESVYRLATLGTNNSQSGH